MIFTFTFSQDETTDIVMKELDTNDVLRFNIDKPDDFAWDFHNGGFSIADARASSQCNTGRFCLERLAC